MRKLEEGDGRSDRGKVYSIGLRLLTNPISAVLHAKLHELLARLLHTSTEEQEGEGHVISPNSVLHGASVELNNIKLCA